MILIFCDGDVLEARNVGPVKVRLRRRSVPLKPAGGYQLLEDDAARARLRELVDSGLYDGWKVADGDNAARGGKVSDGSNAARSGKI